MRRSIRCLPGGFPLGLNFGGTSDDSIHNGRTYVNEFSGSWEHRLPRSSSFSATFVLRRSWDYQSGDDLNVIRNQMTGALVGRPFPQYDTIRNTYNPNYTWQEQRSLQFLYTQEFRRPVGHERELLVHSRVDDSARGGMRRRDTLQFYGISPEDVTSELTAPRHHGRVSTFVNLPFDDDVLGVLHLHRRQPLERPDRELRAERDGALGGAVERPGGVRPVLQRRLSARAEVRRRHADRRRFAPREHPVGKGI